MAYVVVSPSSPAVVEWAQALAGAASAEVVTAPDASGLPPDTDLVVVARGAQARNLIRAHRLVLVVPEDAKAEIDTVGAAFDGRPRSRPALNTAISLAGDLRARLLVLGVRRPAPPPTGLPGVPAEAHDDFASMLGKVSFSTHGGSDHRVLSGRPGPALAAASADVDLLVVGSGGHGVLRGGVAQHLVEHAACPVLVVPHPA